MFYALLYDYVDDMITLRAPFREQHLALIAEYETRGEMVVAGALTEPVDGAILVFRGETPAAAEKFVSEDPYVVNGLVPRHTVRPWALVLGASRLEG
jgi:uncharacterized protein YciI